VSELGNTSPVFFIFEKERHVIATILHTCSVDGHAGRHGAGQLIGRHPVQGTTDPAHAASSPVLGGCRVSVVGSSHSALKETPERKRDRRRRRDGEQSREIMDRKTCGNYLSSYIFT